MRKTSRQRGRRAETTPEAHVPQDGMRAGPGQFSGNCVSFWPASTLYYPLFHILRRQRMLRVLGLPHDRDHVPALAVVEELKAVDAARERLPAFFTPRLIGAKDVDDVGEALLLARQFAL